MLRFPTLLLALSATFALPALAADDTSPLPNTTVPSVDLQRYAGKWYEQASLPLVFARDCVSDTTALYTPQEDGTMAVRNRCLTEDGSHKQADGEARQAGETTAQLEVRFAPGWLSWLPAVWGDYWVIALDEDYQWAMVGGPKQENLWILAREPQMDAALYADLVDRARRMGYPMDKLERTPHTGNE